jgi:hypothetical protein
MRQKYCRNPTLALAYVLLSASVHIQTEIPAIPQKVLSLIGWGTDRFYGVLGDQNLKEDTSL